MKFIAISALLTLALRSTFGDGMPVPPTSDNLLVWLIGQFGSAGMFVAAAWIMYRRSVSLEAQNRQDLVGIIRENIVQNEAVLEAMRDSTRASEKMAHVAENCAKVQELERQGK